MFEMVAATLLSIGAVVAAAIGLGYVQQSEKYGKKKHLPTSDFELDALKRALSPNTISDEKKIDMIPRSTHYKITEKQPQFNDLYLNATIAQLTGDIVPSRHKKEAT